MSFQQFFSVPVFFILFRESLETAVIVSVLLSLVQHLPEFSGSGDITYEQSKAQQGLIRRLKRQILGGAATGLFAAFALGFVLLLIYHWFTRDLFAENEDLWEGVFSLAAACMMLPMSLAMLRMQKSKVKWQWQLHQAMTSKERQNMSLGFNSLLFVLPMVTVLREGLEGLVFVAGIALGEPISSIPLGALAGLACGLAVGFTFLRTAQSARLSTLLVISSIVLLFMGAGLFAGALSAFSRHDFVKHVGSDVGETGDGPGSFDVRGVLWHFPYGNPENKQSARFWALANALVGWQNTATYQSIIGYVAYWWAAIGTLVYLKWAEGRTSIFGIMSSKGQARLQAKTSAAGAEEEQMLLPVHSEQSDGSSAMDSREQLLAGQNGQNAGYKTV